MTSPSDENHRTLLDLTLRNERFMKIAPLCFGSIINFILAVLNGITGFTQSSLWENTLTVYFLVLCFMGSYVAACTIKPERYSARTVLTVCGVSILILALAIALIKYQVIGDAHHEVLHPYLMIALAAITFFTAVTTVIDATRARHGDSFQQASLRISTATVLGMLMMLEQQMLGTYGTLIDAWAAAILEGVAGLVVVLLLLAMGISLLSKARKA